MDYFYILFFNTANIERKKKRITEILNMGRFLIYLSYIGTHYSGFQSQPVGQGLKTIQGQLDIALKCFNPANEIRTVSSSRTDAGVHALENTVHVDLIKKNSQTEYDPDNIKIGLNRRFRKYQDTISVTNVLRVPDDFHSRKRAVKRTYLYRLAIPFKPIGDQQGYSSMSFFESKRAQIIFKPVNIEKLMACAELMTGTHDYTSFTTIKHLREENKDPMRSVSIEVKLGSPALRYNNPGLEFWEIHITSHSFLYRQIRRMIGTMIQVSLDYFTLDDVKQMLLDPDLNSTNNKIKPSPPHGLYLKNVCYDPKDLIYDPTSHLSSDGDTSSQDSNTEDQDDNT